MNKLLMRNWGLKLFSFVLAVGLWHYAIGEEAIEVKRAVPLQIHVQNTQISLLESSTHMVQVTLAAQRALLSEMTYEDIRAVHKIGEDIQSAGEYSFRLEPREIKTKNPQIRILKIEPEIIHVTLDELIVQKLAIKPQFVGEPAFGYQVQDDALQLDPNAIMIEGPMGEVSKLEAVLTESINLVGRIRSFRRTVTLDLPDTVKTVGDAVVDVYIPIKEEFEEKAFEKIPVKILRSSRGLEKVFAEPPEVSFTVKGSVRQLERLLPEKILAYVDASDLGVGEHSAVVELVLPEDVTLKEDSNVGVQVIIEKK